MSCNDTMGVGIDGAADTTGPLASAAKFGGGAASVWFALRCNTCCSYVRVLENAAIGGNGSVKSGTKGVAACLVRCGNAAAIALSTVCQRVLTAGS